MREFSATTAIIPLPHGSVLLPGTVLRIPVSATRPDITALLSHVYNQASEDAIGGIDNVNVACVPIAAPFLGPNGQRLISGSDKLPDSTVPTNPNGTIKINKGDLFQWGTLGKISGIEGRGNGSNFNLLVQGMSRVAVSKITQERPHFLGTVTIYSDEVEFQDDALKSLFVHLKSLAGKLVTMLRLAALIPKPNGTSFGLSPLIAQRLHFFISKKDLREAGTLADFMANILEASFEDKLQVLLAVDVKERLSKVIQLLERQIGNIRETVKVSTVTATIVPFSDQDSSDEDVDDWRSKKFQRARHGPLTVVPFSGASRQRPPNMDGSGDDSKEANEMDELGQKLEAAKLPPEAKKIADREFKRLKKMSPFQGDHAVIRGYLETLAELPWSVYTEDRLGKGAISRAQKQLDDDHYGLEKVKKRLLEYLAVLRLKQSINDEVEGEIRQLEEQLANVDAAHGEQAPPPADSKAEEKIRSSHARLEILKSKRMVDKSPILLLVGPPGVGKTSLARSVATALGRKFHRLSLGGVRDEAEIRGHRRTYVAAMPGLIVQGLKKVGVSNPVFLLDEIDKLSTSNHQGDPSAAMLEVLDPAQNDTFTDHYINTPIDLSKVLFIATANSLDTIPPPLLDRMETIHIPGYTTLEKRHIAMQHLVPKQIRVNGLAEEQVTFSTEVVSKIIESYTRESGVRNLEREIGSVCRAKAVELASAKDEGHEYSPKLTLEDIEGILGIEKFEEEIAEKTSRPGIVTGLVAYSSGGNGSILFIEVADMPGSGSVQLTGKLGDVLKESVEVALSWVKAHAYDLALTADPAENIMKNRSIHVHCPSGSIPKDGPSSGIAQAIALISLFSGKAVPPTMAMTGEISLRGRVTAVGGIKEKLIGALRAGVKTVLLPSQNRKDVKDLPQEVRDGLEIIHVSHIWEALGHVWPDAQWPGQNLTGIESRL